MKLTDEKLKELFLEAVSEPRGPDCPGGDELARAAEGALEVPRSDEVAAHLVTCADCAQEYRLLRALWDGATKITNQRARPARELVGRRAAWRPAPWYVWAAAAAVVAAALILPLVLREPPVSAPLVVRGIGAASLRSLVPDGQVLPRERVILRWRALPGARYVVEVATTDFTPLATAQGLKRAEYRVPPGALSKVRAGGRFLWTVTAILPDGRRITSASFANRVR